MLASSFFFGKNKDKDKEKQKEKEKDKEKEKEKHAQGEATSSSPSRNRVTESPSRRYIVSNMTPAYLEYRKLIEYFWTLFVVGL